MMNFLDPTHVRTIVDLADHLRRLRDEADVLKLSFAAGQRGFFTPSEDDQVLHLWVSYHKSRAALFELIDSVRRAVGVATQERAAEFAVAYAAALILIDAARCLRERFADNTIVRRKLNESFALYGICEGSFDAIQLSLTDPANALRIRGANQFYDKHQELFVELADEDDGMRAVVSIIDLLRESVAVPTKRYLRARMGERRRDTGERLVKGNVLKAIYAVQEWGSRLVSNLTTMPGHLPCLPEPIADSVRSLLRPGDVFVTRKECAVTNYFLPGYWPHAAMYVGSERVIESLKDGVRERTMDSPFGNDAIALIRPKLEVAMIDEAIRRARTHIGKPYDFDFDFTRADRMVCTEVVYRSYDGIGGLQFELKRRVGRQTLSAEDLLELAMRGQFFEQVAVFCPQHGDNLCQGEKMTRLLEHTVAKRRSP